MNIGLFGPARPGGPGREGQALPGRRAGGRALVDAGSMGTAKRQMENVVKDALVAKEVAIAEDTSNDGVKNIMREVELHRLCSANCPGAMM